MDERTELTMRNSIFRSIMRTFDRELYNLPLDPELLAGLVYKLTDNIMEKYENGQWVD